MTPANKQFLLIGRGQEPNHQKKMGPSCIAFYKNYTLLIIIVIFTNEAEGSYWEKGSSVTNESMS